MNLRILESAIRDLELGKAFYDQQESGIGEYFQDCLFSEIDSLVLYCGIHRKVFGYYRMLSRRFPYAIYYKVLDQDTVLIFRVLDCRRNPTWTSRELGES